MTSSIGGRIRARRLDRRMSVPALAGRAGLTTRFVEMIEAGDRIPSIPTLYRLADALDSKARDLLPDREPVASG